MTMSSEVELKSNSSPSFNELEPNAARGGTKVLSLPPRSRRSTSIGGSVLGSAKTKELDPQYLASLQHASVPDSATSSDDEGTSRQSLRRAIVEYRRSLTLSELSFLKELVSSGSETHIERALDKLNDDTIFSPPPPDHRTKSLPDGKTTKETYQRKEEQINQPASTTTQLISGSGEDSLILLERFKNSLQDKDHSNILHVNDAFDLHKPIDILDRTASFGSEARGAHIEKRMASTVHGHLWKAHESGISLTSSQRSRFPIVVGPMDRPESIRRSTSAMSSSTMDLVENGGPVACDMLDPIFRNYSPSRNFFERKAIDDSITGQRFRPHSRSDSIASMSSMGSSHFDWPPSNFETVFRTRIHALQQRTRSPSLSKKIHSLDLDDTITKDIPLRFKQRPPIGQLRRDSSNRSISSIPSLHRASLLRSYSTASSTFTADDNQQSHGTGVAVSSSLYNLPPRVHRRAESERSSSSSYPSIRRATALRADSVASSVISLNQIKDHDFADFAKKWLTGDDRSDPSAVYDAPRDMDTNLGKKLSDSTSFNHQIVMKSTSDGTDDGVELELLLLDQATRAQRRWKQDSSNQSFFSHSSINSHDSNRNMYTMSLVDRMSSDGDRSTSISYPFWTPSTGKDSDSNLHNAQATVDDPIDPKSWDMQSEGDVEQYNAWDVLIDEFSIGYGYRDLPFKILGTSADDVAAKPHVLSPPLMESLSNFFPDSVAVENWWLKYSLIRDGASMYTMLQKIRGSTHTLIAIETVNGEVFGSFTSKRWRKSLSYYGSGESFLWKMRKTRKTPCQSVLDQAQLESEIEVFPWSGCNNCVQICNSQNLIVGGGTAVEERADGLKNVRLLPENGSEFGLGLVIEGRSMLYGSSNHCATFNNSPLSNDHSDGSPFEIMNLEVWTMTPADNVELAERLELGALFLESQVSA